MNTPIKDALTVTLEKASVEFKLWGTVQPSLVCTINQEPQTVSLWRSDLLALIAQGHLTEFVYSMSIDDFVHVIYCSEKEEICYTAMVNRSRVLLGQWVSSHSDTKVDLGVRFQNCGLAE